MDDNVEFKEIQGPVYVGTGSELVNAPEEFKDPDLYIEFPRGSTKSYTTLLSEIRSSFKKFLAHVTGLSEDEFEKGINSRMIDYIVGDYLKCHGIIKANNTAKFIYNSLNRFVVVESCKKVAERKFDELDNYQPPIIITSCPSFVQHLYLKDEYKGQYIIDLMSKLLEYDLSDVDTNNPVDIQFDGIQPGLSDAELRKRIKYAKSYQERRYYQQLLGSKSNCYDKKCTKKKHKKK